MKRPHPHVPECLCRQCVNMAKAITAQNPDGSYVFSDEELLRLSLENDDRRPRSHKGKGQA